MNDKDKVCCCHLINEAHIQEQQNFSSTMRISVNPNLSCCRLETKTSSQMANSHVLILSRVIVINRRISHYAPSHCLCHNYIHANNKIEQWALLLPFENENIVITHHLWHRRALTKSSSQCEITAMWHCNHTSPSTSMISHQEIVIPPALCTSYY